VVDSDLPWSGNGLGFGVDGEHGEGGSPQEGGLNGPANYY